MIELVIPSQAILNYLSMLLTRTDVAKELWNLGRSSLSKIQTSSVKKIPVDVLYIEKQICASSLKDGSFAFLL